MSEHDPDNGWTVRTVLKHLQAQLNEMDRRYEERFRAQEKAVSVFEASSEKWRANSNEWRDAMNDREKQFAKIGELSDLRKEFEKLVIRFERGEGSSTGAKEMVDHTRANLAIAIAVVAIIVPLITYLSTR